LKWRVAPHHQKDERPFAEFTTELVRIRLNMFKLAANAASATLDSGGRNPAIDPR